MKTDQIIKQINFHEKEINRLSKMLKSQNPLIRTGKEPRSVFRVDKIGGFMVDGNRNKRARIVKVIIAERI